MKNIFGKVQTQNARKLGSLRNGRDFLKKTKNNQTPNVLDECQTFKLILGLAPGFL